MNLPALLSAELKVPSARLSTMTLPSFVASCQDDSMQLLLFIALVLFAFQDPASAAWVVGGCVALKLYLAHRARYF